MAKTARKRNAKATTKVASKKTKAASKTKSKKKAAGKTPLYLTEADMRRLVTVKDAITTLELLLEKNYLNPNGANLPRQRATIGNGALNLMGGAWGAAELFGLKAYYGAPGGRFHVLLYSSRDCALRAMIEADHLGRMRTGAASGLATSSSPTRRSADARRHRRRPAGIHPGRGGVRRAQDRDGARVHPHRGAPRNFRARDREETPRRR